MTPPDAPHAIPAGSTIVRSKTLERLRLVFGGLQRVSPTLAARVAGELFRRPRRHARPEREVAWEATAERIELPYEPPRGASRRSPRSLSALSWGTGPTVLLQHGWEGRASQMGAFAAPLVARGFRVVALDAPAHGSSGGKSSSMIEFAAGLRAAGQALGPAHAVVGHSLGAAATSLALREGLDAERLVFVAPPYDLDAYFALFLELLGLGPEVHARMVAGYERHFACRWDDLRRVTAAGDDRPLLVVHDADDQETPLSAGRAVAEAWTRGALHATAGLGHLRVLRSRAVVERVADALGDASAPLRRSGGERQAHREHDATVHRP